MIAQVAGANCTVLILGESGAGKEVVAQTIHRQSGRRGPFVAVNCGAIPALLLESELFGHERGAFTNAHSMRVGRFEQADGGTLFLDEVAELRPDLQVKLLRAIQERAFERVGGVHTIRVDVRILSATNQDLEEAVQAGRFRADLFYRLNVIAIEVPPLRERTRDIASLAQHIIGRLRQQRGHEVDAISTEAFALLQNYSWPGNVRELENLIERAMVLKKSGCLEVEDFPGYLAEGARSSRIPTRSGDQLAIEKGHREGLSAAHGATVLAPEELGSREPARFFQWNMQAVNACLRGARRQSVAVLCLVGLLGGFAAPALGALVESRAESQAAHWVGRALPQSGAGSEELRQGLQKFQERDYTTALATLTDARRLGAGSAVEEVAVFLVAESRARAATGPQEIRAAIIALEEARRRYFKSPRAGWGLWRIGSLYRHLGLNHEAMARLEQLLRQEAATSPLLPFIRLDLADVYIAEGRYAHAGRMLRLVRQFPPDAGSLGEATIGLSDIAHALGQYRQARDLYIHAEAQWPTLLGSRPISLFGMADSFLRLGDWARAIHILNTGYAWYPRDPFAATMLVRMADGVKMSGQIRQSKDLYRTVVERYQGSEGELQAWLALGEIAEGEALAGAGEVDVQEAYGEIARRWSARPIAGEALLHLGQSHQRANEIEEAAAVYDELLRRANIASVRAPARQGLEAMLRALSAAGKTVEVANFFIQHELLLTKPVVDGPTGLMVAGALGRLGLADPAIRLMEASLAAGVSSAQREYGLVVLAELYRKKGDQGRVEAIWKEYLRKYPKGDWSAEAREGLIIALGRTGNHGAAETTCRAHAAGSGEKSAAGTRELIGRDVLKWCADLLAAAGHLQVAEPLYREILKDDDDTTDSVWASYQLANAAWIKKRTGEAVEFLGRVAKTDKDSLLASAASAQLRRLESPE